MSCGGQNILAVPLTLFSKIVITYLTVTNLPEYYNTLLIQKYTYKVK